ncbi:hypothetical protein GC173_16615 [bacterium]|nr:hypothetical protein [bacterium]
MGHFDMPVSKMTPWLADRIIADHFIEDRRRASFLSRHFAAPGLLGGVDLATGENCPDIHLGTDGSAAFFLAHTLGPARIAVPPEVTTIAKDGARSERSSFFRTTTRHWDDSGNCPFIIVAIASGGLLAPSPAVVTASHALSEAGFRHAIERPVRPRVWHLWMFLEKPQDLREARRIAERMRSVLTLVGLSQSEFKLPIEEEQPSAVHLPYHFFYGDVLGCLHILDDDDQLIALNPNTIPVVSGTSLLPADQTLLDQSESLGEADGVARWVKFFGWWRGKFGARRVRAGEVVKAIDPTTCLPPGGPNWTTSPQAASIWLGRRLQALGGHHLGGHLIEANRSGNSTVFRLVRHDVPPTDRSG